jgi:hypothetical protein
MEREETVQWWGRRFRLPGDESPAHQNFSPESLGGGSVRMVLVVENPDAGSKRPLRRGPG